MSQPKTPSTRAHGAVVTLLKVKIYKIRLHVVENKGVTDVSVAKNRRCISPLESITYRAS